MTVDERQLQEILKALEKIQEEVSDPKERRKIMRKPADIVKKGAQSFQKDSPRVHKRYSTPKIVSRRRAKKGSGVVVATYYPGNLRKSIKRLNFKKTFREYVGPKLKKGQAKGEFGLSATKVDGYYAAMSRGRGSDAETFRKEVMEPGLNKSAPRAYKAAVKAFLEYLDKLKRKTGL